MRGLVGSVGKHALLEILSGVSAGWSPSMTSRNSRVDRHVDQGTIVRRGPQPRPEGSRHDDGDRSGRRAPRLWPQHRALGGNGLDDEEQSPGPQQHRPARVDRESEDRRELSAVMTALQCRERSAAAWREFPTAPDRVRVDHCCGRGRHRVSRHRNRYGRWVRGHCRRNR
jgi:hypothetical protein